MTQDQIDLDNSLWDDVRNHRLTVADYDRLAYNAASPDARDCACHQPWGEAGGGENGCVCPGNVAA